MKEFCPPLWSLPQSVELEKSAICSGRPWFPKTYHAYQIQQLKHLLCVLLNHAVPAMDSLTGITPRNRTTLNEGFSCLLQKVIKQSDSPCLIGQRVVRCEQSDSPCPLQMCALVKTTSAVSVIWYSVRSRSAKFMKKSENGKLVRIVTKCEYTRHRDGNSCWKLNRKTRDIHRNYCTSISAISMYW